MMAIALKEDDRDREYRHSRYARMIGGSNRLPGMDFSRKNRSVFSPRVELDAWFLSGIHLSKEMALHHCQPERKFPVRKYRGYHDHNRFGEKTVATL
jgi:hypothetical protein